MPRAAAAAGSARRRGHSRAEAEPQGSSRAQPPLRRSRPTAPTGTTPAANALLARPPTVRLAGAWHAWVHLQCHGLVCTCTGRKQTNPRQDGRQWGLFRSSDCRPRTSGACMYAALIFGMHRERTKCSRSTKGGEQINGHVPTPFLHAHTKKTSGRNSGFILCCIFFYT